MILYLVWYHKTLTCEDGNGVGFCINTKIDKKQMESGGIFNQQVSGPFIMSILQGGIL